MNSFLKSIGLAESGVMAKELILAERVMVNGEVETRRGRKLHSDGQRMQNNNFLRWEFENLDKVYKFQKSAIKIFS